MQTNASKLAIILIILTGGIIYLNSLFGPFVLDDISAIVNNPDIKKLSNISTELVYLDRSPYKNYYVGNNPIRPLTFLSFMLNYAVGKLNTFGYHLVNVSLHIIVALLIFFLCLKLLKLNQYDQEKSFYIALLTAIFFLVHPINTEIVSYIYHRSESLVAIFFLLSVLFFIKGIEAGFGYMLLSLCSFILALSAKENAAVLPFVLLLTDYFFFSRMKIKGLLSRFKVYLLFAIVCLSYIYIQRTVEHIGNNPYEVWTRTAYLSIQPYIILKYLKLFFVPTGLCFYHVITPLQTLSSFKFIVPWLALIISFIILGKTTVYAYRNQNKTGLKLVLFFIFYFIITIAPSSSIIPIKEAMTERRLYLPGVGFYFCLSFFLVTMLYRFLKYRRLIIGVVGLYLIFLSYLTIERNLLYSSEIKMWESVVDMYPNEAMAVNTLAVCYAQEEKYDTAIAKFKEALKLAPKSADILNNIGRLYQKIQKYEQAEATYLQAIELNPASSKYYYNFGDLYFAWKKYDQAIAQYKKCIELAPNFVIAHLKLLQVFYFANKYLEAIEVCNQILAIDNTLIDTHYMLGLLYKKTNQPAKAIIAYENLLKVKPEAADIYNNLAILYKEQTNYTKATELYKKAIALEPNYPLPYINLGNVYLILKEDNKARDCFEKYLKLKPTDTNISNLLSDLKKQKS